MRVGQKNLRQGSEGHFSASNCDELNANRKILRLIGAGFTLIEAMIVIGVLSVLIAVAVPQLSGMNKVHKLRGQANSVAGFVERGRRVAYNQGRCVRLRVDTDHLVMERRSHADCVTNSRMGSDWDLVDTLYPEEGSMSFAMTALTNDGQGNLMVFRPNNRLRGDGDSAVNDDAARVEVISNQDNRQRYAVNVTATGQVCLVKYGTSFPSLTTTVSSLCP